MLPSDALKALAAAPDLALLIDRRGPSSDRVASADFTVEAIIQLRGHAVTAYLVKPYGSFGFPAEVRRQEQAAYVRLMDRFYVPVVQDSTVVAALFDLIAELYDDIILYSTNLHTARCLLQSVLKDAATRASILDFGCGTGIAHHALEELGVDAQIVGTDISAEMLRRARIRGEAVMTIEQWRASETLYQGVIASFVLHYGVSDDDLAKMARSLRPGGRFAANFFKPKFNDLEHLVERLTRAGLRLIHCGEGPSQTVSLNPIVVFERPSS